MQPVSLELVKQTKHQFGFSFYLMHGTNCLVFQPYCTITNNAVNDHTQYKPICDVNDIQISMPTLLWLTDQEIVHTDGD